MGSTAVNGDSPQSTTVKHITSYPIVSDSIKTIKSNPYGGKAFDVGNAGYDSVLKTTGPYLEKPASYIKPYAAKVDEMGDNLLSWTDERVPILTKDTSEIKGSIVDFATYPFIKAGETRDWVFKTYNDQYQECGGDGVLAAGKAIINTELVIASDVLNWLTEFLKAKKKDANQAATDAQKTIKTKAQQASDYVDQQTGAAKATADKKAGEAKETAKQKTNQ